MSVVKVKSIITFSADSSIKFLWKKAKFEFPREDTPHKTTKKEELRGKIGCVSINQCSLFEFHSKSFNHQINVLFYFQMSKNCIRVKKRRQKCCFFLFFRSSYRIDSGASESECVSSMQYGWDVCHFGLISIELFSLFLWIGFLAVTMCIYVWVPRQRVYLSVFLDRNNMSHSLFISNYCIMQRKSSASFFC